MFFLFKFGIDTKTIKSFSRVSKFPIQKTLSTPFCFHQSHQKIFHHSFSKRQNSQKKILEKTVDDKTVELKICPEQTIEKHSRKVIFRQFHKNHVFTIPQSQHRSINTKTTPKQKKRFFLLFAVCSAFEKPKNGFFTLFCANFMCCAFMGFSRFFSAFMLLFM